VLVLPLRKVDNNTISDKLENRGQLLEVVAEYVLSVLKGQSRIAQHFSAGSGMRNKPSPVGTTEHQNDLVRSSFQD